MTLSTKKTLYGICATLAPIIGVLCGLCGGILVAIQEMFEPSRPEMMEIKQHELTWTNAVHLISPEGQKNFIGYFSIAFIGAALVFLALIICLSILCGQFSKLEDNKIKLNWFDKVWTELHIVFLALACCGAVYSALPLVKIIPAEKWFDFYAPIIADNYVFDPISNKIVLGMAVVAMLICIEIAILCWISIVKKFKAKEFVQTSLIGKICKAVARGVKGLVEQFAVPNDNDEKAGKQLMHKAIIVAVIMMLLAMTWVGAIVDIAIIILVLPKIIRKYMNIRKGVAEVKAGNLNYNILVERNIETGELKSDLDKLADDINQITLLSNTAVQNELKNQRMKTDLISNVSHDLKTPLTSMISYLDILNKEGLDSPDAAKYLEIVNEKTMKLKTLTEDLFEAAKASSGSIPCEITAIDLSQMIEQEIAEFGDVFQEKGLEIIRKTEADDTTVQADGKLLARVIENLLTNISKYALEGSRVYIDLSENGINNLRLDIKNISRDQLNISAEELMERFTRGDDSRNTEGSGLGLAIAKDLTRLMGGEFDIIIDGDMFKASILLRK